MVKNSYVKDIALIAMLSAASVAGRIILEPLPNIQPTTVIVIVTTMALRLRYGLLTALLSVLLSNLFQGHGLWSIFQIAGWWTVAVVSYFYGKTRWRRNVWVSAVFAGFAGLIYGMVVSLNGLMFTKNIIAYYLAGLPFDLAHALGNFVIYLVLGGRILTVIDRSSEAYFQRK